MAKTYKYSAFGKHLRSVRKIKYPELRAFSKITGIPEKQLYDYETGRIFPPIEKFITICKYLDKSAAYMLSPFIDYTQNEKDIMNFFEEADVKQILKDEEIAKILKFTLLGFQLLYLTKSHFNHKGDVITYLNELKSKLFEEGQLKRIK